jgi:cobalt-zinc-cadmium resistance protein CzcA
LEERSEEVPGLALEDNLLLCIGIVLVSHFRHLREGGLAVDEAVRQGAVDRLWPVLMTALIAVFSLVPMLFASGPGSEIQKPLATIVVGGLLSSTFLTLFLIPVIYRVVENAIASGARR